MKFLKLHITLLFFWIWSFSFSQEVKNYSVKNGLPSNHVYRITQDLNGFIWIITDKGIVKFDGKNFKIFTTQNGLPNNDIWNLKITKDNKKWFFSKANKIGYIQNDSVFSFASDLSQIMFPRIIKQQQNNISFSDVTHHYSLKNKQWITQKYNQVLSKKHQLKLNSTRNSIQLGAQEFQLKNKFKLSNNKHLGQINDSLFISFSDDAYWVINANTKKLDIYSFKEQNLPKNTKYVRYNNVNNSVQITGTNFVGFLDSNHQIANLKKIPEKYKSHFSFIDKQGNTWLATFRNGVYFLPKNPIKVLAENEKIQFIKQVNDNVYVGIYQKGLFILQNKQFKPVFKNNYFQFDIATSINKNTLLYSNNREVFKIIKGKKELVNSHIQDTYRNSLFRKSITFNNYIYGHNFKSVNKINPITFKIEKSIPLFGVSSYSKTKNSLFIATQGGLITLQNDSLVRLKSHSIFSNSLLSSVTLNTNEIIVGTDGNGAFITNGKQVKFIKGTEKRSVENIFIDRFKNIWMATEKGVYKAIKKDNTYTIEKNYLDDDGLISNKTNDVFVKNDTLFVATDIGLSVINLKKAQKSNLLNLYIKLVALNEKPINLNNNSFKYNHKNQLSVSFNAVGFFNQNNLQYSYKLAPIQKQFTTLNTPEINFSNLGVNNYKLYLKVKEPNKNKLTKSIEFRITPLWYQTTLFKGIVVLLFIFLIFLFTYFNGKRISKKAKEQAKIKQKLAEQELYALRSQMNPHFVFNSLNAIQYYITQNNIDLSEKYLVRFSRLIRMFFDFSAESSISITQEISLLKSYLEIEKMRFGNGFNYTFNIDYQLDKNTQIPTMLLQPIVENAVNHGIFHNNQKGTIILSFKYISDTEFYISIKDNGIGIKKSEEIKAKSIKKHQSKSTQIISDRIQLINQSKKWFIQLITNDLVRKNEQGTEVVISFKKLYS